MNRHKLLVLSLSVSLSCLCAQAEDLVSQTSPASGQTESVVQPETIPQPVVVPTQSVASESVPLKISLTAYYSTANTVIFNNATVSNGTTSVSGDVTYNTNPALSLGFAIAKIQKQSLGFSGSLFYESERKIESIKYSDSTGSVMENNVSSKFSVVLFEGALNYRFDEIYVSAGVNYSVPMVQDGGTLKSSAKGDAGFSVGSGVFVNDKNSIELFYRTVGVKMTAVNGATVWDFGTGYSQGLAIGWKYWL